MARVNNVHLEEKIEVLELESSVYKTLKSNEIITVRNLWEYNRKKLKEIGLKDSEIKQITIKLQLLGLDLNKKVYN